MTTTMEQSLKSSRPYLIRAMHEWMSDNGQTPLVLADTSQPGVRVPAEHIKDGRIVLNVSWSATSELVLGNEAISFNARFGGVGQSVYLPTDAVIGMYARESGQGMVFQDEESAATETGEQDTEKAARAVADSSGNNTSCSNLRMPNGPGLRLVK
jgi:stringent starvation protein B